MAIRILSSENITGNLTLSGNQTTGGDAYVTGTSNSLVVISRDNMFVDAGQFYIGADDGSTDDSFRQQVSNGSFFINTRKSGTWTNRLQINTAGTLIVQQGMAISGNIDGVGATFIGTAASGAALVTIENNSGSTATSYGLLVLGGGNSSNGRTFEVRDDSGNTDLIVKGDGNVGINTATPQKKVHIEGTGGASEMQILVSSASDTVGHTAGIGLRGEGGEADGDFRIKGGIFFERIAGSFGNGKMILAVNSSVSNTSVTVADHALTIDTNKNVGIGTASPSAKLEIVTAVGADAIRMNYGQSADIFLGFASANPRILLQDNTNVVTHNFQSNGDNYIVGSNVGIGTTSPDGKLEVAGGTTLGFRLSNAGDSSAYDQVRMTYSGYNSGSPTVTFMPLTTPGSGNAYTTFLFQNTNGINASSNNNANVAIDGTLQVGRSKGLGETTLIMNNYDTSLAGTNQIQNSIRMSGRYWSGSASQLVETRINSVHQESDGNGGSALTFMTQTGGSAVVEQMRIDKVGNVGIKTTPSAVLHIYNQYDVTADTDKCGIRMTRVAGGSQSWLWSLGQSGVSNNYFGLRDISHGVYKMMFKEGTGTQVMFGNPSNNGTFGASNTVLSIKGSTSGGEGILQITGLGNNATDNVGRIDFHSYNEADPMASIRSVRGNADDVGDLEFYTNSGGGAASKRMTITDTGNVFIADNQNSGAKLYVKDSKTGSESSSHFQIKGNGYDAFHWLDTVAYYILQNSDGRQIRIISSSGGVKLPVAATAWQSNSDIALKENLKPLENVLDKIKDYRCVEYNLKESPDDKKIGFIAQDWENDFSAIVDKDENDMLNMKYTETIPVLLKAIQELKAEIELLKNK